MRLRGDRPTPWPWGLCALLAAVCLGMSVTSDNWLNALAQLHTLLWIWTAHHWRTKANNLAQGAHQ